MKKPVSKKEKELIRVFIKSLPHLKMHSVLVVHTDRKQCVFYMRDNRNGLHYGRVNINLEEQGWKDAQQFIEEKCKRRTEVRYMKEMNKELNALIIGGAKHFAEKNRLEHNDEVGLRRVESYIEEACMQAGYYGLSPEAARNRMRLIAEGENVIPLRADCSVPFTVLQAKK